MYPELVTGLGSFLSWYEIQLKPDVQPVALYTARHVTLPWRMKVKDELAHTWGNFKDQGANIMVLRNGCSPKEVRICVDFRALKDSVMHPLLMQIVDSGKSHWPRTPVN